jgi:hypothetical protein
LGVEGVYEWGCETIEWCRNERSEIGGEIDVAPPKIARSSQTIDASNFDGDVKTVQFLGPRTPSNQIFAVISLLTLILEPRFNRFRVGP